MKRIVASLFLLTAMLGMSAPVYSQDKVPDNAPAKQDDKPKHGRGHKRLTPERRRQLHAWAKEHHGHRIARHMMFQTLPPAFDCADKGWMSPVGDQGSCGSCYLYSTAQNMTDAFIRAGYGKPDGSFILSPQFGMDCHDFGGCNGGNGNEVVDWACKNGWYAEKWVDLQGQSHTEYPAYEARSRSCRVPSGARKWTPATWGYVTSDQSDRPPTVEEVKTALYNYGTLNIALDAGGQFGNGTGTITALGSNIDHEIRCTAYDDNHDNGDGTKGAVKFVNQWNTSWGNNGTRWASYKVIPKLVSVFWVSAGPLPDPVPPTPPGPGPGPIAGPVITSNLTAAASMGLAFTYQISASGSPTAFAAQGLPAGLTINTGTGLISGTPTAAGTSNIMLLAANSSGAGSATMVLTVTAGPVPPMPGAVTITLTADQVTTVLNQAGAEALIVELQKRLQSAKADKPQCCGNMEMKDVDTKTADDIAALKRAVLALMARFDAMKETKEPPAVKEPAKK